MKKKVFSLIAVCAITGFSFGDQIIQTYAPSSPDLMDLDHYYVYSWGINSTNAIPSNYTYTAAQITFTNIADWIEEDNKLDVHLLSDPVDLGTMINDDPNLTCLFDYKDMTGYWDDRAGAELVTYSNLPTTTQTLTYNFDVAELAALNSFAADGRFGIGIDPDCHFFNDGVTLTLTANTVPEPGIFSMLGVSMVAFGLMIRRKKAK